MEIVVFDPDSYENDEPFLVPEQHLFHPQKTKRILQTC